MSNTNQDHSNQSGDDKLDMQSPDLVSQNFEKLAKLFPNCVTESATGKAIDFDLLKQELNHAVVEGNKERYRLEWPGKREAIVTANLPTTKTLRPIREDSVDFDNTENIYIEGDNLEVLKLLQESYLGRVDMIFIDPPYNTGNDFIYKDNFTRQKDEELFESGQKDELSQRLIANPETAGRYHSDWLTMMFPRLKLARNLLSNNGVIFISIDDNEQSNLKKLCDEIFGEENYINTVSINSKVSAGASGGGEDKKLKKNIEYLLIYAKSFYQLEPVNPVYKETLLSDYISQMKKDGKSFKYTNVLYKKDEIKFLKSIKDGAGNAIDIYEICDFEIKTIKQISAIEGISEDDVFIKYYEKIMTTTNAQTSIRDRVWDATGNENQLFAAYYTPKSGKNKGEKTELLFYGKQKVLIIWLKDTSIIRDKKIYKREKIGTYWDGFSWINVSKEGDIKFDNGKKPISMIQRMLSLYTNRTDALIVDFFSGSASTAHAVIEKNSEDLGNRKFIMVQVPEVSNEQSEETNKGLNTICDIGKERIRRATKKIKEETSADIDYGFRVYRLDESNMQDVYYRPQELDQSKMDLFGDNVKPDRTEDDLLAQVMLDWGLPLSLKIEQVNVSGKKVFKVAENSLFACFDKGIDEAFAKEIAKEKPLRIVFKDAGFKDDTAKTNVKQLLKQLSPETEMKVL